MCKCNPEIRTPFCGAVGCEWPEQEKGDQLTKHNHVTRDNKPQEFYIRFLTGDNYSTHQITDVSMNKLTDVPSEHDYHVIEYSAYEKLQQENEYLKSHAEVMEHKASRCNQFLRQTSQALEVAEVALKFYALSGRDEFGQLYNKTPSAQDKNVLVYGQVFISAQAREALKQIAKIKKGE